MEVLDTGCLKAVFVDDNFWLGLVEDTPNMVDDTCAVLVLTLLSAELDTDCILKGVSPTVESAFELENIIDGISLFAIDTNDELVCGVVLKAGLVDC